MLRELGFGKDFTDSYVSELRVGKFADSVNEVLSNIWLNLSGTGAAAHLQEILTSDKERASRWKHYLKSEKKRWKEVEISDSAKAMIAIEILETGGLPHKITGMVKLQLPAKNVGALRKRFARYEKKYPGAPG